MSRVLPTSGATRDIEVESFLRDSFPDLVTRGLVTVHTKACTPEFLPEDLATPDPLSDEAGCNRLVNEEAELEIPANQMSNLITPLRTGGTLKKWLREKQRTVAEKKEILRPLLEAAIAMVPDGGPWIIHADCHLGNVLLGADGTPSLSDWGRTVVVKGLITAGSVRSALEVYLTYLRPDLLELYARLPPPGRTDARTKKEWYDDPALGRAAWKAAIAKLTLPAWGRALRWYDWKAVVQTHALEWGEHPQHPRDILMPLKEYFQAPTADVRPNLNVVRGWLPYVLLNEVLTPGYIVDPIRNKQFADVLTATTQAELRARVMAILASPEAAAPAEELIAPDLRPSPSGGVYWPRKYFRGLTRKQNAQRKRSATRRTKLSWKDPKAYVPFKTDLGVKTRRSSYTSRFRAKYPNAKTLPEIAKATGIAESTLQTVYNRGMAAWRTGHRPGASQHAWGMARVHSFVLKGKTARTADADLARKTYRRKK